MNKAFTRENDSAEPADGDDDDAALPPLPAGATPPSREGPVVRTFP